MHAATAFFIAALLTLSSAYTAPSTQAKFLDVLQHSKLQAYDSVTYSSDPSEGYSEWFFQLVDNSYMQFQMKGHSMRSELRQETISGDKAAWDVMGRHVIRGTVILPTPVSEMNEITFLQVHCTDNPALRMNWRRSYDGHTDEIFGSIRSRPGLSSNDVRHVPVGQRSSGSMPFILVVTEGKAWFKIGGQWRLRGDDISGWSGNDCYFKAGAYVNNPSSDSAVATVQFDELRWYQTA